MKSFGSFVFSWVSILLFCACLFCVIAVLLWVSSFGPVFAWISLVVGITGVLAMVSKD